MATGPNKSYLRLGYTYLKDTYGRKAQFSPVGLCISGPFDIRSETRLLFHLAANAPHRLIGSLDPYFAVIANLRFRAVPEIFHQLSLQFQLQVLRAPWVVGQGSVHLPAAIDRHYRKAKMDPLELS